MDEGRKYRQQGYMDSDRRPQGDRPRGDRPRPPQGPKTFQDPAGPRLPRLVQNVTASRCYNCATTLPAGFDFKANCPKCSTPLHCCKQCAHFEPSTRFQCLKPIKERIPSKDKANECELFSPRVTVMRDAGPTPGQQPQGAGATPSPVNPDQIRRPSDARAAFDSLFKKE